MNTGIEKRKERRIGVRLPVRISYRGSQIAGETENISRLGAYIETSRNIPLGAELTITLSLSADAAGPKPSAEINCLASVFRSGLIRQEGENKYYGLGVFFTSFPQQSDRDELSSYMDLLTLREEQHLREGLKQLKERRASSEKIQAAWQADCAKCLAALKQILAKLQKLYSLAQAKK